ncbi:glutathione peroxidase [Chitinophaga sp. SYP-B3965]|uniref:glutathione peroxidase n=1 Tax=Chitinophaga sp. SYP-B3965 TaxID=2663120 RepID=UPI001299E7DE|nr:glutathione peroxidase [Chitinophaga sp. SYP-B3965]MRG46370.1 glutathione peroxidase [Chitinophaga sp. SYP-B3965]
MFKLMLLSAFFSLAFGNIYDFKVDALDGGKIDFSKYKGKKIMVVNTASMCGNTPQYAELEKLAKKYKNKLVIIGFPANNFGGQEPGSNAEIKAFCTKEYAVTFPMAAKISVKGSDIHPLYQYLLAESKKKQFEPEEVQWNFQKYLLDEKGELVAVFKPRTSPTSPEVIAAIEK